MYIIGAGAQAKYVIDIIDLPALIRVFDPIGGRVGQKLLGIQVEEYDKDKIPEESMVIICVADPKFKKEIYEGIKKRIFAYPEMIHRKAVVADSANIQGGCIVNANATIQPDAFIGMFTMVHANVSIDHDSMIGFYCNIAPGATICGHVQIGDNTVVGPGAVVTKNVSIGRNTIIGAGSVVLSDIPNNVVAYGTPCKIVGENL